MIKHADLAKAFEAGQMSLIEYLIEVRYLYDAIERFLEAERELQNTMAILHNYQL